MQFCAALIVLGWWSIASSQQPTRPLMHIAFDALPQQPLPESSFVQPLMQIEFADLPHDLDLPATSLPLLSVTDSVNDLDGVPFQWWEGRIWSPILAKPGWLSFDAAALLVDGLTNSPRIKAVSFKPLVAEADIVEADAAFDPAILLEQLAGRTSDPVGNSLVTGGAARLREVTVSYRMGLQDRNRSGGQFEAIQEVGLLNNNSVFLTPPNQGNSRLSLSLTQPLLAGAGRVFNERLIVQAQIDNGIAWQESSEEVQTRLADIYAAYWQLYELRAAAIQQYDLLMRGQWVEKRIEQRAILDTNRSQIVRAQAAITRRRTQMIQATAAIGDQQSRMIALVGSPYLSGNRDSEFIPLGAPQFVPISGSRREAVMTGLQYHPRIRIAAHKLQSAALAMDVTRNQLLPVLNAVLDTYVAGLNGRSDVFTSLGDQFTDGEPGFSAGLEYSFPIGNRAAQARHRRQQFVLRQQQNELQEVLLEITAEIEIAHRAMEVAKAEIEARRHALEAARTEEAFFAKRWQLIPTEDGSASFLLEDLLDSQERRTDAERQWVAAKVKYLVSIARLQQSMGTLLMNEGIEPVRIHGCEGSEIMFQKNQVEALNDE